MWPEDAIGASGPPAEPTPHAPDCGCGGCLLGRRVEAPVHRPISSDLPPWACDLLASIRDLPEVTR